VEEFRVIPGILKDISFYADALLGAVIITYFVLYWTEKVFTITLRQFGLYKDFLEFMIKKYRNKNRERNKRV